MAHSTSISRRTLLLAAVLSLLFAVVACNGDRSSPPYVEPERNAYCVTSGLDQVPVPLGINEAGEGWTFEAYTGTMVWKGPAKITGSQMELDGEDADGGYTVTIRLTLADGGKSFSGSWAMKSKTGDFDQTWTVGGVAGDCPGFYDQQYDYAKLGLAEFVEADYIDSSQIGRISKFRSAEGHDYSDDFEGCRSMKHYFEPKAGVDWSTVKIYSPVTGTIVGLYKEWVGTKVWIQSAKYPAVHFEIFHVNLAPARAVGEPVSAGEQLGTHGGSQTTSDISISFMTPDNGPINAGRDGFKLVSFFEAMPDAVFAAYQKLGAKSRDEFVISKTQRDADPLVCDGENIDGVGSLDGWFVLTH